MDQAQELKNTLSYIQSELSRMETIAGTLSTIEHEHYKKLTKFSHQELVDIAVEEQHAARQLGTIKQMCLTLSHKVDELIKMSLDAGSLSETRERAQHAEIH